MIISLILLFWHEFLYWLPRGIILQAYYLLSAIVAFLSLVNLTKFSPFSLGSLVQSATEELQWYFPNNQLFHLDKVFYADLAFYHLHFYLCD